MEAPHNHIDELIGKYLTQQASAEELTQLQAWEAQSADNAHYLKQMQQMYADAGEISQWQTFDSDAAWLKLKAQLPQSEAKQVHMKPWAQPWLRVAATILLLIAASVAFYEIQINDKPELMYAATSQQFVKQDTLPDGTKTVLNKNSEIRFSQTKKSGKRVVELKGEAFFEVAEKEAQDFLVQAGELLIEDIGTAFNVKAFEDSTQFEVFVESGEVRLFTASAEGIHLKAGESGRYDRDKGTFTKISAPVNVIAYKSKNFNFNNASLGEVIEALNASYGANIQLQSSELAKCRLFVQFADEDLDTIITIISETLQLTVKQENHEIILQGQGCGN